jgi:RimJ/RimL family protein N-acetyltransferase
MLRTHRLLLRPWRPEDRAPFAQINADPRVMEFFPAVQTREESDASVERVLAHQKEHGFCFWAVERLGGAPFIGFVGLKVVSFTAPFTPTVEIGWRLAYEHWGQGYATEGARASLRFGFETLGLRQIVSFTAPANVRSRRVMEKLGMQRREEEDFDHPLLAPGHPLRRHVLYRLTAETYHSNGAKAAPPT